MEEDKEMRTHIPLTPIRRLLELHCPYHISSESTIELRNLLEKIGLEIARDAVAEFEKLNRCREKQGLRRLKRLNAWAVRNSNFFITFINSHNNKNKGLQFEDEEVVIPGSDNMSAQTIAAKPDNKTTDDRRREVV